MGSDLIEPKYGHNETRKFKQPKINMHKCLLMIPQRFAIEMISRGWILRNQIIWHKPNAMPESATDRFTMDYEVILFFVKSKKYYFDQQKEPSLTYENRPHGIQREREDGYDSKQDKIRVSLGKKSMSKRQAAGSKVAPSVNATKDFYEVPFERNKRSVWTIPTKPHKDAHFAIYPQELIETPIKSGCPENGVVLDPFIGSGTTGLYARKVNRNYIGIELNPENVELAKNRISKELGLFQ